MGIVFRFALGSRNIISMVGKNHVIASVSVMNAYAERVCACGTILSKCVASLRVNQKINLSDVPTSVAASVNVRSKRMRPSGRVVH